MKNLIFTVFIFTVYSCAEPANAPQQMYEVSGKTMGTTYKALFLAESGKDLSGEIDMLLKQVNQETSTYIPSSTISTFNKSETGLSFPKGAPPHFKTVFSAAKTIWNETNGHFDPTVMPVVNYWGFGYTEKKPVTAVDSVKVDSMLQLIGFEMIEFSQVDINSGNGDRYIKKPGVQLDFSAIAKGYGVDAVGKLLESNGIQRYLVEIGGEVRARGKNQKNSPWVAGINMPDPDTDQNDIQNAVSLNDMALATSGNYRNFYEVNGVKYAHTIDPKSGYPAGNQLLSASVLANDCMTADAFATAFMVMGLQKSFEMAERRQNLEAYFIYSDQNGNMQTRYTPGMAAFLANK